ERLERPALLVEHDPGADQGYARPGRLCLPGRRLPGDADLRHRVVARRAVLGQLLVAVRAVVAPGRGAHQHLRRAVGPGRGLLECFDDVVGAVDAAGEDFGLEGVVPAPVEEVAAGEVDDRVAAGQVVLPGAGFGRVADDDRTVGAQAL